MQQTSPWLGNEISRRFGHIWKNAFFKFRNK